MRRTIATVVVMVAVVGPGLGAKGLRIPRGHRNDPPKTVEDQNRENAERARKQQEKAQKEQAARQPVVQQRPTTGPSASTELARAQGALDRVEKRLWAGFEKGDEYVAASGALKNAQDSYDVAYKGVVVKLGDNAEYAAAVKGQKAAEDDLAAARKDGRAQDAAGLAGKVMEARKAVHTLEADAADKDDAVKDAKTKVAEAKGAVDELRKGFEAKIKEDPDYVAAQHAVEDAKSKKA